jgi:hypothetical protein
MIKNSASLKKFEDEFIKTSGPLAFNKAIRLFTAMWKEAVTLGVFPPKDPLEGIEVDINIAKILNSCSKKSCPK